MTKWPRWCWSRVLMTKRSTGSVVSKGWMGPPGDLFHTVTNWPTLVGVTLAARNRTESPSMTSTWAAYAALSASGTGSEQLNPHGS